MTLAVGAGGGGAGEPEGDADAGDRGALPLASGQAGLRESIFTSIIGQVQNGPMGVDRCLRRGGHRFYCKSG